jgi:membrane protein DedA with SNARE-associated domain
VFSPVAGWLHEHLYAVVFLGAVVDAIGLPFPGRLMLIAAGSFSHPESRVASDAGASAWAVIALATVGTVAGDHVWYLAGRLKGRRLFELYCRLFRLSDAWIGAADRFLRRFGGVAIVLARFAATLRVVVAPLAVSRGMSYGRFMAFDLVGAVLWVSGFVWLGRAAGATAAGDGGLVGALAIIGTLATASTVVSVLARRHVSAAASR